jgi:hypothetical protein
MILMHLHLNCNFICITPSAYIQTDYCFFLFLKQDATQPLQQGLQMQLN